ncbi:hypothetical protein FYJ24_09525 [Actinomycetaceae bacterium WB03_NA08]|uniref:Uncharacterized protein n=1 Tax=Scrofimicrobium canadense TaxID=2652290 RepID=A0A6N7VTA2_9ACTO|nr:hypothetical protein [Scrofimicrobium canadense]MSS84999.1 hypothetical protein [Scrofimicrobium canadense]
MARITDNLVIQRVGDDKLVIIDDETKNETVIPIAAGVRLTAMAAYLTNPEYPLVALLNAEEHLHEAGAV